MTGRDALRAALRRFVEGGGTLVGEAVGVHGLTEGFTTGLVRTPLSESATVGVAVGFALAGKRVVVELVDPAGLARAADVLTDLAGLAARSSGAFAAPIVVRAPWKAGMVVPPGLPVAVAGVGADVAGLLEAALASNTPTILLESAAALDSNDDGAVPGLGVAVVRRAGEGATILAVGDAVAAALATPAGEVVDLRGLSPIDRATVSASVKKTGRAVAVGAPDALLVALQEAFLSLEAPLAALPADASAETIAAAVASAVHY